MNRGTFGFIRNPEITEADTELPVGSVVAWMRDMDGAGNLPDGWLECNGQRVTDKRSPLYGQVLPDLNGDRLYLRGGPASGVRGS